MLRALAEHVDAVRHLAVAGVAVILAQPLAEQFHQCRIVGEFGVVQAVAALFVREVDATTPSSASSAGLP